MFLRKEKPIDANFFPIWRQKKRHFVTSHRIPSLGDDISWRQEKRKDRIKQTFNGECIYCWIVNSTK